MLLRHHVASLGNACSVAQKNKLLDQRRKLEARISAYECQVSVIIKLDDDIQWSMQDGKIQALDTQAGEVSDDLLDLYPDEWFTPERERITLPSALAPGEINWLLVRSPFVSGQKCVMQTANGPQTEHGSMFISLMLMLESIDPHTDRLEACCSICQLTWNTWRRFTTSPTMT